VGQRKGSVEDVVNPWQRRRVFLAGHTGFKRGLAGSMASCERRARQRLCSRSAIGAEPVSSGLLRRGA
jgi:hypothetical protein